MERQFASIFADVLELPTIGIDDDFFEIGGTSLDAMVAVSKLKSHDINLTMQDIYQYKSIRHLAEVFEGGKELVEVELPDHLSQLQALVKRRYQLNVSNETQNSLGRVLLTGGTGFLGAYLINELQDQATKVTCLVRGQDIKDAHAKVEANLRSYFETDKVEELMDKVEVVLGDLANLDAFNVEDTIDTIIHAGARTDHFGDDENFIHVNVQSTEALLALAHQHQAKFIYISTISVGAVFDVHTEDKAFLKRCL